MSVNINISQPRTPGFGGMPGFGAMPSFGGMSGCGGGMPGLSINDGHNHNGGCCDSKKSKDCGDKKDKGIIGNILSGLFGEDSFIGKLFGGKEKKSKCKNGCGHNHGGVNINLNSNQRASGFGF
ncbi:MAG: hypothetical protein WC314_15770 [Vulcanimicrobiota bacterium]